MIIIIRMTTKIITKVVIIRKITLMIILMITRKTTRKITRKTTRKITRKTTQKITRIIITVQSRNISSIFYIVLFEISKISISNLNITYSTRREHYTEILILNVNSIYVIIEFPLEASSLIWKLGRKLNIAISTVKINALKIGKGKEHHYHYNIGIKYY